MSGALASSAVDDHRLLREGAGLFDRSQRGKLALTGAGAIEFLNGQVTNELAGLRAGEGRYAAFLTHKGHMLGDLRVIARGPRAGEDPAELLLDTERVTLQALFDMIRRFKVGYEVELHKRTIELAELSLIGPRASEVAGAHALGQAEHSSLQLELDGTDALAVRTDTGIELFADSEAAERLTQALRERGAQDVGEAAVECLRVERGVPRYGVDLDDSVIPQEAGLNERAVSFTKGCYVGQETVARLFYRGKPNRHLRGLRLASPAAAADELRLGEKLVGALTSPALSPTFGPIALALVRRQAEPGATVQVGTAGNSGEVVELPFAA